MCAATIAYSIDNSSNSNNNNNNNDNTSNNIVNNNNYYYYYHYSNMNTANNYEYELCATLFAAFEESLR